MARNDKWIALGAIAIAAVAGVVIFGNPFQSTTGFGAGTPSGTGSGICPDSGAVNLMYSATFVDLTNNGAVTPIATNVAIYKPNAAVSFLNGTTSTSGDALIGQTKCGQPITAYVGDGGANYYYQKIDASAADTNSFQYNGVAVLKKSSAPTIKFENTATNAIGTTAALTGVTAGVQNSDVHIKIQASQYYFGDGEREICAAYNSSVFSSVKFGDLSASTPDAAISAGTDRILSCYKMSGDLFKFQTTDLPVVLQVQPLVTPNASTINFYLNDLTGYIKNGAFVSAYTNENNADLGRAIVTATAGITVN